MIAIIIPYYKLTFFEATLQSLANQTDKRFKVYIGNDASLEDCTIILDKFKGKFDFVYYFFETNLGGVNLTQQWDRCIGLSKDERWLIILGDDDVLGENVIAEFYKNIDDVVKNECNIIHFASEVIDKHGQTFLGPYFHPKLELATDFYFRKSQNLTRSSLSEYIFKKKTYEKYGFVNYPLAWHSDDKAWLDFSEDKPIFTINSALIYIRFSEINISGKQDNIDLKLEASFQFFKDIFKKNETSFSKIQLIQLLMSFELVIKKHRKLNCNEWFFLGKYYLCFFSFVPLVKFVRRFLYTK